MARGELAAAAFPVAAEELLEFPVDQLEVPAVRVVPVVAQGAVLPVFQVCLTLVAEVLVVQVCPVAADCREAVEQAVPAEPLPDRRGLVESVAAPRRSEVPAIP